MICTLGVVGKLGLLDVGGYFCSVCGVCSVHFLPIERVYCSEQLCFRRLGTPATAPPSPLATNVLNVLARVVRVLLALE